MKRSIFVAWSMALFLFCPSVSLRSMAQGKASEVLRNLTFELPKAFYVVKGKTANYRSAPNAKGKRVNLFSPEYSDLGRAATPAILLGDMGNNATWVSFKNQGKNVYVSKSVLRETKPTGNIFPSCYNKLYGWIGPIVDMDTPDGLVWRVGVQKGGAGLAVCDLNYYGGSVLLLGKKIGNIFVFKYAVDLYESPYLEENMDKPYIIDNESSSGEVWEGYKFLMADEKKFGVQISSCGRVGSIFDLTKLTDAMLYQLFHEVIEKDIQTHFFLDAEKFSEEYLDHILG